MRKLLLILLPILITNAYAFDKQKIMKSDEYYYGEGISSDVNEARDRALAELTSQIAVHVASSFTKIVEEKDDTITGEIVFSRE